jgi:thermitase
LPIRFLNRDGVGDTEDAIKGVYYAIQMKASVINFSFAGEGYDKDLYEAIQKAGEKENDALVVVSASNDGVNVDRDSVYPPKFQLPNQITVAASDKKDGLWDGSNWGKKSVHIAAPGEEVFGPWFDKWDTGSGTSDAAAIVSGAAGLLRSIRPDLTAYQIKKVIIHTARRSKMLKNKIQSGGVLDLEAAVSCITTAHLPCLQ